MSFNLAAILLICFSHTFAFNEYYEDTGELESSMAVSPPPAMPVPSALKSGFNGTWPRNVKSEVAGDIVLGALMMVHERENEPMICGKVMAQGGIQALEATLFSIDWVNRMRIIPYTTLGALILDDCDKDTYGLQQAVHFIKGSISSLDDGRERKNCTCSDGTTTGNPGGSQIITGVLAAASSVTSVQVANLLKLFKIPQVSFFSTSPELGNQERFNYFFRTIPSDDHQVTAMVNIIEFFNWSYVSVVYEESSYGIVAFSKLEEMLDARNICIAAREKLPKDSEVSKGIVYERIVQRLLEKKKARAVVVYGSDQEVRDLMKAVKSLRATGQFTFIGSDGWSSRDLVYRKDKDAPEGLEAQMIGTISVQPMAKPIPGFHEYFSQLTVYEHNERNPWFYEFWEAEFDCRFPGTPVTPYNTNFTRICTGDESVGHAHKYEEQLQFVSDSVLVFAYAIRNLLEELCPDLSERCVKNQYPSKYNNYDQSRRLDGTLLKKALERTEFTGLTGQEFKFDGNGGPPRYNIIHFRYNATSRTNSWYTIGTYTTDGLELDTDLIRFYPSENRASFKDPSGIENLFSSVPDVVTTASEVYVDHMVAPYSRCSTPCEPGNKTASTSLGDKCCWVCVPCQPGHYQVNKTTCAKCPNGWRTNRNRTACLQTPEDTVHIDSIYGLLCLAVAFLGTSTTFAIFVIFVLNRDTPVVKASGRELSFVILVGLFMCFGITPLMLVRPSDVVCGLQRFFAGFCFTVVYAAILTKANRIARIFQSGKRTVRRPIFISPESQLVICTLLSSVQILLMCVWLYTHPPRATAYYYPTEEDNQFVCQEAVKYSYLVTYVYPIILCVVCTVYAFQTRKIPEAFNESKYIGAAVYTTLLIWLAFVPIYFVVKDNVVVRVMSVCISTSLTAIVCQVCLFVPKVYIIIWRPERNVRQSMIMMGLGSTGGVGLMQKRSSTSTMAGTISSSRVPRTRSDSSLCNSDDQLLEPLQKRRESSGKGALETSRSNVSSESITTGTQTSPVLHHHQQNGSLKSDPRRQQDTVDETSRAPVAMLDDVQL